MTYFENTQQRDDPEINQMLVVVKFFLKVSSSVSAAKKTNLKFERHTDIRLEISVAKISEVKFYSFVSISFVGITDSNVTPLV